MTTDELAKLTPEQKQNRIAELHGWTEIKGRFGRAPGGSEVNYTPDYYNDLNATHEMEMSLTEEQRLKFRCFLVFNSDGREAKYITVEAALCHATATERADAFLRIKGLNDT